MKGQLTKSWAGGAGARAAYGSALYGRALNLAQYFLVVAVAVDGHAHQSGMRPWLCKQPGVDAVGRGAADKLLKATKSLGL